MGLVQAGFVVGHCKIKNPGALFTQIVNLSNLTKIVSNNFTTSGAVLTYTFTVRNTGNITANNVILIDTIPSGTTFIANSVQINGISVSGNPQTGILIGDILANDLIIIIFTVKVN